VVAVKEWVVMLAALSVAVPSAGSDAIFAPCSAMRADTPGVPALTSLVLGWPAGDDNARNAKVDTEPRHMESG
jgi:hypothetical protein